MSDTATIIFSELERMQEENSKLKELAIEALVRIKMDVWKIEQIIDSIKI